jgi:hypothetical protein
MAAILMVTRFVIPNRQHGFFIFPPDPITDGWGMPQILPVQAQPQAGGGIHQHIQHFLTIAAAGQGFVGAAGAVQGYVPVYWVPQIGGDGWVAMDLDLDGTLDATDFAVFVDTADNQPLNTPRAVAEITTLMASPCGWRAAA